MATTDPTRVVLNEAGLQSQRYDLDSRTVIAAMQVVELQRIADALEIIAAQGRHLPLPTPPIRWRGEPNHRQVARHILGPALPAWAEVSPDLANGIWEWVIYDTADHAHLFGAAETELGAMAQVANWVAEQ